MTAHFGWLEKSIQVGKSQYIGSEVNYKCIFQQFCIHVKRSTLKWIGLLFLRNKK